ncbi:MAG: hypothetical protein ACJAU0_000728 [Flavobacteriales bacterium]|jgi:hypothetical protein
MLSTNIIIQFFTVFLCVSLWTKLSAQTNDSTETSTRFFMPALQMGYIHHNSDIVSEGLVIQTSLEYRAKHNLLFRINYDDFSGRIDVNDAIGNQYTAKVPLSELLGGIGYRLRFNKHNLFALIQSGVRFYELPEIVTLNGVITINQSGEQTVPIRYTIGYEYEFMKNVFFNIEAFVGHFAKEKDYWSNDKPFFGTTIGLSTTLF